MVYISNQFTDRAGSFSRAASRSNKNTTQDEKTIISNLIRDIRHGNHLELDQNVFSRLLPSKRVL